MRKGKARSGAGHIKQNTQGTSNEISFSVLDAKNAAHASEDADQRSPLGRISLFTLGAKRPSGTPSKDPFIPEQYTRAAGGAPSRPSWEFSEQEVRQHRAQRRRRKTFAISIIVVICLIGAAFAGTIAFGRYQQMQERARSLSAQLEDISAQVTAAEPLFQLIDRSLATPLPEVNRQEVDDALAAWDKRQQSIMTKLRASKTTVEQIMQESHGAQQEEGNEALAAINAMQKALDAGKATLQEVSSAANAYEQAKGFVDHAMQGDSDARAAASLELSNDDAANQAITLSDQAQGEFVASRDAIDQIEKTYGDTINASQQFDVPTAELLKPFRDYCNLRIDAQSFAKEADQGYLDRSSQRISEANASYNADEEEAASLIASLRDQYPTAIVQRAYEATIGQSEAAAAWRSEYARTKQLLGM